MATTTPGIDILDLLADDHREAESLLNRFESVPDVDRDQYFCQVVQELVRHEVAEELVVYPALRSDASGGDQEADARIHEQAKAEQMLAEMEELDVGQAEFQAKFVNLREAVLEHAKAEESGAFVMLRQSEDADARTKLASALRVGQGQRSYSSAPSLARHAPRQQDPRSGRGPRGQAARRHQRDLNPGDIRPATPPAFVGGAGGVGR